MTSVLLFLILSILPIELNVILIYIYMLLHSVVVCNRLMPLCELVYLWNLSEADFMNLRDHLCIDALFDIYFSTNYWLRNLHVQRKPFPTQEKSLLIDMFIELPPDPPEKCWQGNGTLDKLMGLVYVHGMLAKCYRVYQYLLENAVINIFLGITLVSTGTSAAAINSIQVPEELATV